MRVLIVGCLGQLGTDLVQEYNNEEVIPFDVEDMDITNEEIVFQQIAKTAPDLVINAAAFTRVDECEQEHLRAFQVNAIGSLNLAVACKKWDIPFAHISTNYVFDGEKDSLYVESDSARPINSYGLSKLAGEYYIQYTWEKHFIFRVAGLFGLTPSRMKGTNFVEAMLRLGSKGTPLKIVSDEYLTPTYTKDAAVTIRHVTESTRYGIYHLTNTGCCTWLDFAKEIFQQSNLTVSIQPVTAAEYGALAKRPKNSCLENKNLNELGLQPLRSWQEALKDYLLRRSKLKGK